MKNLQKGFVVPLIIAIIAVLAIGGGIYYSKNKSKISSNTSQGVVKETADWKTYSNNKYGFEFKYPPTWYMSENGALTLYDRMVGPALPAVNKTIGFSPNRDKTYPAWNKYKNEDIKAYAERFADYNKGPGELLDTSAKYLSGDQSGFYQVSTKTIDRNPIEGCEYTPCPGPAQKNVEYRQVTTYIPQGDSVFLITASIRGSSDMSSGIDPQEEKEYLKVYQQFISTFKFIKPTIGVKTDEGYLKVRVISQHQSVPLEGYRVSVSPPGCADKTFVEKTTDKNGTATFALKPGKYCVLNVHAPANSELTEITSQSGTGEVNILGGQTINTKDFFAGPKINTF